METKTAPKQVGTFKPSKRDKAYELKAPASIKEAELLLAEMIAEVKSRGGHSVQRQLFDNSCGVCALGALGLLVENNPNEGYVVGTRARIDSAPAGNDCLDSEDLETVVTMNAGCGTPEARKRNRIAMLLGAAFEDACRPDPASPSFGTVAPE